MPAPDFGLVLCGQFPRGDDASARFTEQLEQVRYTRDTEFGSVPTTRHYLVDSFQYPHPRAVLSRFVPEPGRMRIDTVITLMTGEPSRATGGADLLGRTPGTSSSVHSVLRCRGKRSPLSLPRPRDVLGDPRARGGSPCDP